MKPQLAVVRSPALGKLLAVRSSLKARFFEREHVIDCLLAAALARVHVAMIGPPGTAKSALANALTTSFDGASCFSWLLTRFTTPEEILGPVSLKGLENDRFVRLTAGKLPEAHVVFLDEVFKASSSILNTLLSVVNERTFHNDGKSVPCPLVTLIGASNELPEGQELSALWDRFTFKLMVPYLADPANVLQLVQGKKPAALATMGLDDLEECQREADALEVPAGVWDLLLAIKERSEQEGFRASDRRWRQLVSVLKAWAYLDGAQRVDEDHVEVLADVLWNEPKDRPALAALIAATANPAGAKALEIQDAARAAVKKLGSAETKDPTRKAEWLSQASLVDSQLDAMLKELSFLASGHRGSKKAGDAIAAVGGMRQDIAARVAQMYGV